MTLASWFLSVFVGVGPATSMAEPARAKWEAPTMSGPLGGQLRTTIYYGPWKCNQDLMNRCQSKCGAESFELRGCMWLADIKTDWKGRFGVFPVLMGGRLAIMHCCCNYPKAPDAAVRRDKWDAARKSFRQKWIDEFGEWPAQPDGTSWPGHHIRDLRYGGDPVAKNNLLPARPDVHDVYSKEYPLCYSGKSQWSQVGIDKPYDD